MYPNRYERFSKSKHKKFEDFSWKTKLAIYAGCLALSVPVSLGLSTIAQHGYSEQDAVQDLTEAGYQDIQHEDTDMLLVLGCDKNDFLKYDFTATGPTGIKTEIIVCKGLLKSATIRMQ